MTYLYSNKDLRKLIIPLVIEQLLAILVGIIDTVMIAGAGEAAVSGVSLVDNINILVINIFSALATGGAVVVGHYLGERDETRARKSSWQLIYVAALSSAVVMVIYLACNELILTKVFGKIEIDVYESAKTYLIITALSMVPLAVYNGCAAVFRAMSESKITMWIALGMNIINIIGNAILIYGMDMGVAGAAIATTMSRLAAGVVAFVLLFNKKKLLHLNGQLTWKLDTKMVGRILHVGVPSGLENSLFQLGKILLLSLVATFGTYQIAANAASNAIACFNNLPGMSINFAIVTVVSVCVGAGDYTQAKYYAKKLIKLAYLSTFACSAILALLTPMLVGFYNLSSKATELTCLILWCHAALACIFWIPSFTLPHVLRASGDVIFPMSVSIVSMWVCRIGAAYLLNYLFHWELFSVWAAMFFDWIVRAVVFVARYLSGVWMTKYHPKAEK